MSLAFRPVALGVHTTTLEVLDGATLLASKQITAEAIPVMTIDSGFGEPSPTVNGTVLSHELGVDANGQPTPVAVGSSKTETFVVSVGSIFGSPGPMAVSLTPGSGSQGQFRIDMDDCSGEGVGGDRVHFL